MLIEHCITLPRPMSTVLGMGAWFKNTLCLIHQDQAWVTRSVGDLDRAEACAALVRHVHTLIARCHLPLQAVAYDLHPDFFSSRYGLQLATEHQIPAFSIQHHHAHIASVCAEHDEEGAVLGLALDGVGLGSDGTAWGGELLKVQGAQFERLGHLSHLAMPGGDKAAREPWRMAAALLFAAGRGGAISQRFADQAAAAMVSSQLQRGINSPKTSSMGRVFDAAAGLLGMCPVMAFEAEAAILLERAAATWITEQGWPVSLSGGYLIDKEKSGQVLNLHPLLLALANRASAQSVEKTDQEGAAIFHATLAEALADWVVLAAEQQGLNKVALSGGCFFNQLLTSRLVELLESRGLEVLKLKKLMPGDMSIALGQAWVAALSLLSSEESKSCV